MKSKLFQEMIGNIDDDLITAADGRAGLVKRRSILKLVSGLAAACLVAVWAVAAIPKINLSISRMPEQKNEAGGIDGKINIRKKIRVEGSRYEFSNEEGYAYLETVKEGIQNDLISMGVNIDNFSITKTGYSHVRTGDAGNSIAVNWKDYIAYDGEDIIAIVTLMKDETGYHHYPAWGSPRFAEYGRFLAEHRGEELVYIWAGDVDAILTPDHQLYAFGGSLASAVNENESDRYYAFFKLEQNTYIPE